MPPPAPRPRTAACHVSSAWSQVRSSRGRTRTCDPPVNSRLLYQLSYSGMKAKYSALVSHPPYRDKIALLEVPKPHHKIENNSNFVERAPRDIQVTAELSR